MIFGEEIPEQWWTLFHSSALDEVIRKAFEKNPTLAAAEAALRTARANLQAGEGTIYFPAFDAEGSASREKFSGSSFGQPGQSSLFTLYSASVNMSYLLDVFGGGRRELEALRSEVDVQKFEYTGAFLTLSANIVITAVTEASLRGQLEATRDILSIQEEQLAVVRKQFELGAISNTDVLAQEAQLAQTRATVPPLEKSLARSRHHLAVLTGLLPGEAGSLPEFTFAEMQLPDEVPVRLPSSLVRNRPDILASEAVLHAASARIGVAEANMYPQLTITGNYGSQTNSAEELFSSGTTIWSISGGLLQPIFHGGALLARRQAAIAAYQEAMARYQETILQAFQNVADVLRALEADARTLKARAEAESSARGLLELTRQQFDAGAVDYLSLLNAQRQYQSSRISLVQGQGDRLVDTAALFQALGGGWREKGPDNPEDH